MPVIGNALKPLPKSALMPLGLTVAASAADASSHKNLLGSGIATLIISNEEINDIMKIVRSLEESGLSIKCISETLKIEAREQKGRFLGMLLGILGASLLGNLLIRKGTIKACEGTARAGQDF